MKKFYSLCALCALLFIPNAVKATVLLNEHFNQATETLATNDNVLSNAIAATGWTNVNGSGQIYMSSTNLSYSGYKSTADATGGSAEYKVTFGKKVATPITSTNSGSLFVAAIMKFSSCSPASSPGRDYLWSFCNATSSVSTGGNHFGRLCAQKSSSTFQLGIAKNAESAAFLAYTDELSYNTPYLVVMEYKFVSGTKNDIVYLYLNPTKGDKPAATLECYQSYENPNTHADVGSGTKDDPAQLASFMLYSTATTKLACLIDELKVTTSWADLWESGEDPEPEPDPITAPEPEESDVTQTSATISWDAVEDADSYILQWKLDGGSYSSDIVIGKNVRSYAMSNLYSNNKYYVRVKTIIAEDASDWAEINFTTQSYPATLDYQDITFNNWSTINALPTSGDYYLANNVERTLDVTLSGDLRLCLNGKTFTTLARIIVPDGVTLTIYDNIGTGSISGYYECGAFPLSGLIHINEGGTLILHEGAVQNLNVDPEDGYLAYAIYNQGNLHIAGNPVISAATADIRLFSGNVITLDGELTNTVKYSVNPAGQVITSGWSTHMSGEKPSDYFVSAKSGYRGICVVNNEAKLVKLLALDEAANNDDISDGEYSGTICASMTRSLTASQFNTFCLPFALSNAQLEDIFGAGYDLEEFVSSSLDGEALNLEFNQVTELEAGKPYLLQPSQNVVNPTFEGVTIEAEVPDDQTSDPYISFHGTFKPTSLAGGNKNLLFLGAGNELFWPESTGNLKGFRAYFEVKGDARKAVRARISKKEEHTTDIGDVRSENANAVRSEKILQNGQILIIRDGKTYNVLGSQIR